MLLEKLASENAVDASAAEKYLDYYATYLSYLADSAEADQSTSMRMSSDSDIKITMGDVVQNISQTTDSTVVLKDDDFIMKQNIVMDYAGTTTEATSYYSDGWMYWKPQRANINMNNPLDLTTLIEEAGMSQSTEPFYLIESIRKTETANGVSYSMAYSVSAMNKILRLTAFAVDSDYLRHGHEIQIA